MSRQITGTFVDGLNQPVSGTLRFTSVNTNNASNLIEQTVVTEPVVAGAYDITLVDGRYRVEWNLDNVGDYIELRGITVTTGPATNLPLLMQTSGTTGYATVDLNDLADVDASAATTDGVRYSFQYNSTTDIYTLVADPLAVNDHGGLTGLDDDDHTQYHNDDRGDARYYTQGQVDTALSGKANSSHTHDADDIVSGVIDPERLGTGTPDGTKILYGDGTWDTIESGALSIGALSAYAEIPTAPSIQPGVPSTIHNIVAGMTANDNETIASADTIGVSTPFLLTFGDNVTVTTAFIGITALSLPAVLSLGSGTTVDVVSGATFALSLDAGATGGTIDQLSLCRALALPNGVTTVNNLYGYKFELPFGNPATEVWGFYAGFDCPNYMQGSIVVGDSDTPTNASVGIELGSTTKAVLLSRMDTTARDALTATNGMTIYNITTDKFQGYAGGSWVDLH